MTSKIQIKAGQVEFTYEGESELSFEQITELFTHIETLYSTAGSAPPTANAESTNSVGADHPVSPQGSQGVPIKLHVNSVAEKLGAKSGSDMAIAAAAFLQICQEKDSFSRAELNSAMKAANSYYKKTMTNNLSKSISTLLKSKINQIAEDKYSIKAPVLAELKAKLA